jgi:hypothetical protein
LLVLDAHLQDTAQSANTVVFLPSVSGGAGLGIRLTEHLEGVVLAREEAIATRASYLTRGVPFYSSGHFRTQLEVRLRAAF